MPVLGIGKVPQRLTAFTVLAKELASVVSMYLMVDDHLKLQS